MLAAQAQSERTKAVVLGLRRRQVELADAWLREIVPGYERERDTRLTGMRDAADTGVAVLLDALAAGRPLSPDDLAFAQTPIRHAVLRGAREAELVRAARVWQRAVWEAVVELAGPDGGEVLAHFSPLLSAALETLGDGVARLAHELEQARALSGRAGRRELVDDLCRGRFPVDTDQEHLASACGLAADGWLVVVAARSAEGVADEAAAALAATTLAHAMGDAVEPLFAVREEEVVIIRSTSPDEGEALAEALGRAQASLAADGLALTVGTSAVHQGLATVPAAYDEASLARRHVAGGGVLAIAALEPIDYLFLRGADDTAWQLVRPRIREFIENDLSQAGLLVQTLLTYVACNMNVKAAAEKLYIHSNTAHYRLGKIQDICGCDLRDLEDLHQLVLAVRIARGRAR